MPFKIIKYFYIGTSNFSYSNMSSSRSSNAPTVKEILDKEIFKENFIQNLLHYCNCDMPLSNSSNTYFLTIAKTFLSKLIDDIIHIAKMRKAHEIEESDVIYVLKNIYNIEIPYSEYSRNLETPTCDKIRIDNQPTDKYKAKLNAIKDFKQSHNEMDQV